MPRFSANIEFLFVERPYLGRLSAARAAGFTAIEMCWPYVVDLVELDAARRDHDLRVVDFNIPTGDLLSGGYGLAGVPGRQNEFKEAVETGREWALRLGSERLSVVAGFQMPWGSRDDALKTLAENLHFAADRLSPDGITVLLEACNRRERPGYVIGSTNEALTTIQQADHPNIRLGHDLYHLQICEGDLVDRFRKVIDFVGHIQFADVPGRGEPGTGEINYDFVFAEIDKLGYGGWCGAEYKPSTARTEDSLGWFSPYRQLQG